MKREMNSTAAGGFAQRKVWPFSLKELAMSGARKSCLIFSLGVFVGILAKVGSAFFWKAFFQAAPAALQLKQEPEMQKSSQDPGTIKLSPEAVKAMDKMIEDAKKPIIIPVLPGK
jgi:hypothetical protein